jgi:CubicO group peptidase (beta-lactamase class C family)
VPEAQRPETAVAALTISGAPAAGLDPALPARLDSLIQDAIADGAAPGAAVAVGRNGRLAHMRGYGRTDWKPDAPLVDAGTLYDLASLTKVIATTTLAMRLEESGKLELNRTVASYLPGFDAPDKRP